MLDFHGEATSEKMAMGHFVDGRVSLCVGTHTHVPTADVMILPGRDRLSERCRHVRRLRFGDRHGQDRAGGSASLRKLPTERLSPAAGEGTLCAVFLETDDRTGLATRVEPVQGRRPPAKRQSISRWPEMDPAAQLALAGREGQKTGHLFVEQHFQFAR